MLQGKDATPISPKRAFEYFESLNISSKGKFRHVPFSSHKIEDLDTRLRVIRNAKNTEGAVLYIFDEKSETIGLVKVKATDYVVRRRLRECLRSTLVNKLFQAEVKNFPLGPGCKAKKPSKKSGTKHRSLNDILKKNKREIPLKMARLTHVPNYKEYSPSWGAYGVAFMDWWIRTRIARFDEDKKEWILLDEKTYAFAYYEWKQRYGSLLEEFGSSYSSGKD